MPSASAALAEIAMAAGALYVAPLAGLVMLTVGAAFTRTATAAEVVAAPELSVAAALKL